MKKIIPVLLIAIVVMQENASSQATLYGEVITGRLNDGPNSIQIPGNNTLRFNFQRNSFSGIVLIDSLGTTYKLKISSKTVDGTVPVVCQATQVKENYASAKKNVAVCICKPGPSASDDTRNQFTLVVDVPTNFPPGKAQNRRVELKLSK